MKQSRKCDGVKKMVVQHEVNVWVVISIHNFKLNMIFIYNINDFSRLLRMVSYPLAILVNYMCVCLYMQILHTHYLKKKKKNRLPCNNILYIIFQCFVILYIILQTSMYRFMRHVALAICSSIVFVVICSNTILSYKQIHKTESLKKSH